MKRFDDKAVVKGTREAVSEEFRQVIADIKGEKGKELMRNAKAIKDAFAAAWEDGGSAKIELHKIFERYNL
jgi:hypothetical protein